jgi:DNA-binding GntR family transcriptional regulator
MANRDPTVVERTRYERSRILQALQDRDIEQAAHLMAEHIDGVRESVMKQIRTAEKHANDTPPAYSATGN